MGIEKKSNTLAQVGPIAAPIAGVVVAVALIAVAFATSSVADGKEALDKQVKETRKKLESADVTLGAEEIPLADAVSRSFDRGGTNNWKIDAGVQKLLTLPVKWEVQLDEPRGDEFAQMDVNQDSVVDKREFTSGMPDIWRGTAKDKFENWDRRSLNGDMKADGLIDRSEFDDPPVGSAADQFAGLQKPDPDDPEGRYLTSKSGEITTKDEAEWDRYPFDGKIDLKEYEDRYKPHTEVELGPVEGVEVKVDAATMEIVVSWSNPKVAHLPSDIAYMIERRAPETVAKRESEWRKKMVKYQQETKKNWDGDADAWGNKPSEKDAAKTNKQLYGSRWKDEYRKTHPEPVAPKKPSEWEPVTPMPITGNEYRDHSFDLNVTYTYAVYMGTKTPPMRGQKAREPDADFEGWFFYVGHQEANGHPALVRNRVEMCWAGAAPPNGSLGLTTWHRVGEGDAAKWYRMQVTENHDPGSVVGGLYNMAALKGLRPKMYGTDGTELKYDEILPADAEVDFRTDFTFVALGSKNAFLLNSGDLGDFEIQKNLQGPVAAPDNPSPSQDALEIRCLAAKNGGKDAVFELTRWVKSGESWLRIDLRVNVKQGGDVGREVSLDKPGDGVSVHDAAGNRLTDLKAHKDVKVDMSAGKYDSLEGRGVTVNGKLFDVFGTLYKD